MKALVVYDSHFGYTEAIARAIGGILEETMTVAIVHADGPNAHAFEGIDLLVAGGPTEGHRATPAMKAWLHELPKFDGLAAAAFDTRLAWPKLLSGSAAEEIADAFRKAGCHLVVPPESFIVHGRENPAPGPEELVHVKGWANLVFAGLPMPVG